MLRRDATQEYCAAIVDDSTGRGYEPPTEQVSACELPTTHLNCCSAKGPLSVGV